MRIVVGVDGNTVAGHFGHSEDFRIFNIKDGKVSGVENFVNPGHTDDINPPQYVLSLVADVAIGGTIGQQAMDILEEADMDCVFGVSGMDVHEAVESYLQGELKHNEKGVLAPGTPCC